MKNGIKVLNINIELAATGFMISTDDTQYKQKNTTWYIKSDTRLARPTCKSHWEDRLNTESMKILVF